MKLYIIFILSIFFVLNTQAADTLHTSRRVEPYNTIKVGVTTISVLIPVLEFGFERRREKMSWQAGAGVVIPKSYVIDDSIRGTALGYSVKIDGRIYRQDPAHSSVFLWAGLFYNWFKYPHTGYFSDTQTLIQYNPETEDEYLMQKHTLGCILGFGWQKYIAKRFNIELSFGMGPKVMFTKQRGREDPLDHYYTIEPNIHAIESGLGTKWSLAMQAHFAVGYTIKN